MTITTTTCSKYDHPEFRISLDESIPIEDAQWLVRILEESVRDGARYTNGELIDLGIMLLRIGLGDDGLLQIEEPDFQESPISWTIGVTHSLRLLRLLKDTAESVQLGDQIALPGLRHSVLAGIDLDSTLEQFVMDRAIPEDNDSGWFIGRIDSSLDYGDPTNLRRVSVYEAIVNWPQTSWFLAMPSGVRIERSRERLSIYYRGQERTPSKGSFLAECHVAEIE